MSTLLNKLKELESKFGQINILNATELEKCVIILYKNNYTYAQIQRQLNCLSKKDISNILKKFNLSPIENKKINRNNITIEKRICGLCKKFNQWEFDLEEFDTSTFFLNKENDLCFKYNNTVDKLSYYDERTQLSILYEIASYLNIDIRSTEFKNVDNEKQIN